jgi:hypothetical protein
MIDYRQAGSKARDDLCGEVASPQGREKEGDKTISKILMRRGSPKIERMS